MLIHARRLGLKPGQHGPLNRRENLAMPRDAIGIGGIPGDAAAENTRQQYQHARRRAASTNANGPLP